VEDTPTPTLEPTETVPVAARVNGEDILQSSLDASLTQLNQALVDYPQLLAEGQIPEELALQSLVNRALLSQAAREAGFTADAQMVTDKLAELTDQAGGEEAFNAWLSAQGYTKESFELELPGELEAAWQRDQLAAAVPESMEQVRARQLLFYEEFAADRIYKQLSAGVPVDQVVANNDAENTGYLGWLPRGVLIYPELEDALFSLEPGGFSPVIHTEAGYHIMIMLEKQNDYPLSSELRLALQEKAVQTWLETQRTQAVIEVLP
jgi:parvulin-like peptidyl-prolyl isomerase